MGTIKPKVGARVKFHRWERTSKVTTPPIAKWTGEVVGRLGGGVLKIRRDYDGNEVYMHASYVSYL